MDYYETKKSGQIPAFGNWEYVADLPLTDYFECARQAGLIPPSSSDSSDSICLCAPCVKARRNAPPRVSTKPPSTLRRANDVRFPPKKQQQQASKVISRPAQVKGEEKRQVVRKGNDVMNGQNTRMLQRQQQRKKERRVTNVVVKPVDEDLYKIPSHLLHNSKKKRMLGFFSRCFAPPCRA